MELVASQPATHRWGVHNIDTTQTCQSTPFFQHLLFSYLCEQRYYATIFRPDSDLHGNGYGEASQDKMDEPGLRSGDEEDGEKRIIRVCYAVLCH
jgi:hypothetical protein